MARKALWTAIFESLRSDIEAGRYASGDKLPTEAQLAVRFGVNRHTVRRALGALADNGLVHARRGAGVFVTQVSTDYPLGRRVRFHQNVLAAGRTPRRKMLLLETRLADTAEAEALAIEPSAQVQVCEGLSLIDDNPIAVFRSVFPAARFPNMLGDLQVNGSVTAALKAAGVDDYVRSFTRMNAKLASPTIAAQLAIKPGEPVMRTTSVNVDGESTPVEFGRTWFAGDRVTLILGSEEQHQGAPSQATSASNRPSRTAV